jgi:hypothetical protein
MASSSFWYGAGSKAASRIDTSRHSAIGNEMNRTRGSRSASVSEPVTAFASPFLPWNPNRVARIIGRVRSRAIAAQIAFWIASEPEAAHMTVSIRPPPGLFRSTSSNRRLASTSTCVTALYAVIGIAAK